jgi:hypothetical protein
MFAAREAERDDPAPRMGPAPILLEPGDEWGHLGAALADARGGQGRVVLVGVTLSDKPVGAPGLVKR